MISRYRLFLAAAFGLLPIGGSTAARTAWPSRSPQVALTRAGHVPKGLKRLTIRSVGRVEPATDGNLLRQWPGTYFETRFRGPGAFFKVGPGEVSLRVIVDHGPPEKLVKPQPGWYAVTGLQPGIHELRVAVASESQSAPTEFGGFYAPPAVAPLTPLQPSRQMEFIGDSHTVGYGNVSPTRQCSDADVWTTTDTTQGIAALTAAKFGADYEVNAISGRGVVRNYNGFAADTLPQAYPFGLFDKSEPANDPDWHPQVVVIALGTNDFSTPLNAGEKWQSRQQLHADYEATYVRFVQSLRVRYPAARLVLWATDLSEGEILSEVRKVAARLKAAGETRIDVVPVSGLALTACNYHPSVTDDAVIASALTKTINLHPEVWRSRANPLRGTSGHRHARTR
ncbi:lysophospholipase L1-like esterase [Sphingomonas sp. F9_3S_D5_B_2]